MAVAERKKRTTTASRARGAKKTVRKDNTGKKKTSSEQAELLDAAAIASLLESEDVDAEELLRKALSQQVAGRSQLIAQQLAERAANGDSVSTKLVLAMISDKKSKGKAKKKRAGSSQVEQLEIEPEWQAEKTNEEQGAGTRD